MKSHSYLPISNPHPPERGKSAAEVVGTIIIPLGAGIAAALERDVTKVVAWIALAIVSLLVTLYRPVTTRWARRRRKSEEAAAARSLYPRFEDIVHRFGVFFGDRSDTLDYIVNSEIRNTRGGNLPIPIISDRWFFRQLWEQLDRRAAQGPKDYPGLIQRLEELQVLYNAYHRQFVEPVLEKLVPELSHTLDTRIVSNVEDARERLAHFADDLDDFSKLVVRSSRITDTREFYFPRPKPIVDKRQPTA